MISSMTMSIKKQYILVYTQYYILWSHLSTHITCGQNAERHSINSTLTQNATILSQTSGK